MEIEFWKERHRMALEEYRKALRMGRKEYQQNLSKGTYPYLQVLEELTSNVEISSEVSLGLVQIPVDQIVGTNGRGRSTAFANNFMPLMDERTEFASKWISLCQSHLEEGIHDPIKCYEFYNRFYVIEGNKRVSVLKYFGAKMIPATVTRIVPRPTDTPQSRLYRDFLNFYKITEINYIWFSHEGSFTQLLETLEKTTKEEWDQEAKRDFLSAYSRFEKAFEEAGGAALDITTGDAFLEFLKFFSYDKFMGISQDALNKQVVRIWEEIEKLEKDDPIGLQIQPAEENSGPAKGLFNFLTSSRKQLKVAFVHDKDDNTSGWTYGHELGRAHLETVMGDKIQTKVYNNALANPEKVEEFLEDVVADGNEVIFTTTPRLKEACLKVAAGHPEVKILNCSVNMAYRQIRTYYGRMYEAKFLSGMIAGTMTKTNRVAYVADFPISGLIANINGFARGVQLVNPEARVHLVWSTAKEETVEQALERIGPDIVSGQDMIAPTSGSRRYGLYRIGANGEITNLALPFWNWGSFYERIMRSIQSGSWETEDDHDKSINYWWGLAAGVVDLIISEKDVPEGVQQLIRFYRRAVTNRSVGPFDGFMKDQEGGMRAQNDGYIRTRDIVTMNWLADNVIGKIPEKKEFSSDAQQVIQSDKI